MENSQYQQLYLEILKNLILYKPKNPKIRLGNPNGDGGYVIIDGYNYDCYLSAV